MSVPWDYSVKFEYRYIPFPDDVFDISLMLETVINTSGIFIDRRRKEGTDRNYEDNLHRIRSYCLRTVILPVRELFSPEMRTK